jgi:hypothetical protein
MRERLGAMIFEVSSDGLDWVQLHQTAAPASIGDARIEFTVGTDQPSGPDPGEARFDNLVYCQADP